jgi:sterol desaturase/sphingolipid hydroxylase (fatty acid hydroxylase superfamily)
MNDIIPCVAGLGFTALVFGFILLLRFMAYRETLALAEKGLVKPQRNSNNKSTLIWGIIITAVGLALILGLWPLGYAFESTEFPLGFGPWMLIGLVPTFFGVALILIYVLTREEKKEKHDEIERLDDKK